MDCAGDLAVNGTGILRVSATAEAGDTATAEEKADAVKNAIGVDGRFTAVDASLYVDATKNGISAAAMIADAEKKVNDTLGGISAKAELEERRLAEAKASSAKFIDAIRTICNGQIKKLDNISTSMGIPEVVREQPAPAPVQPAPVQPEIAVEETVRTIESTVSRISPEPAFNIDLSGAIDAAMPANSGDNTQQFTF